jgi:hypothetical protein
MKRFTLLACLALAVLAAAAGPSSANVPKGHGLVQLGVVTCEGIGEVSIVGPRGEASTTLFTTTGQHGVLVSFTVTGTEDGEPFFFSETFGQKVGLTTVTCTQHFEEDGATVDITAVVALVPPS